MPATPVCSSPASPPPSTGKSWRGLFRFFGLGLMAVLVVTLDWHQVWALYSRGDKGWLLLCALINSLFFIVKGVRWRVLLTMIDVNYPWSRAIPVYMAGAFLGALSPGRVADLVKAAYLHRDLAVPYGQGIVTVVMDRLLDLCVMVVIALGVLSLGILGEDYWWPVLSLFIMLMVGVYVLTWRPWAAWLTRLLSHIPIIRVLVTTHKPILRQMYVTLQTFYQWRLMLPLLLSVGAFALLYGGGYCLSQGLGLPLDGFHVVYVMTLGNLVGLLPFTVAGIGTRDLAMILLFHELGLPPEQALAFSMGYLVTNLLIGNSPGCLYWLWRPLDHPLR